MKQVLWQIQLDLPLYKFVEQFQHSEEMMIHQIGAPNCNARILIIASGDILQPISSC